MEKGENAGVQHFRVIYPERFLKPYSVEMEFKPFPNDKF